MCVMSNLWTFREFISDTPLHKDLHFLPWNHLHIYFDSGRDQQWRKKLNFTHLKFHATTPRDFLRKWSQSCCFNVHLALIENEMCVWLAMVWGRLAMVPFLPPFISLCQEDGSVRMSWPPRNATTLRTEANKFWFREVQVTTVITSSRFLFAVI